MSAILKTIEYYLGIIRLFDLTFLEELLGSCIAVFVMAMLYEGLKVLREMMLTKTLHKSRHTITPSVSTSSKEDILFTDNGSPVSVQ